MSFTKKSSQTFLFVLLFAGVSSLAAAQAPVPEFKDQVIAVQFTEEVLVGKGTAKTNMTGFDKKAERYGVYSIERVFPFLDYVESTPKIAEKLAALRRTYYVRYRVQETAEEVSRNFSSEPGVIYAEPVLVVRRYGSTPQVDPDDPLYDGQPYLKLVRLPEAWDMVKAEDASEPIVIAVVDDGGDWDHEDLFANRWINEDEIPDNGIDDDENGFIDDVHGVNVGNRDPMANDPTPQEGNSHGTAVAGVASAVTDNGVGVAGAAWNAELMHINVFCEEEEICGGFDGILYAAANGADIINTSWGGIAGNRVIRLAIDALDLATDMGALIVAAAGNGYANNDIIQTYPDGHPRVLSVGATQGDSHQLAEFTNYGKTVDIFAPGVGIMTTVPTDEKYLSVEGTSFSSPLVAGIAALVKTRFPDISSDALRERLRLSGENIDAENPSFLGMLGGGIVNAKASLEELAVPAVRIKEWSLEGGGSDGLVGPGEDGIVSITFINYLEDARQLTVEMVPLESYQYIMLLDAEQSVGTLNSGDSTTVKFKFSVATTASPNRVARFSIRVHEGSFTDESDVLNFVVNPRVDLLYDALRALYVSTNGDNWVENSGWNITAPPATLEGVSTWYGVIVNQGQVLGIILPGNKLSGTIPSALGQLQGLQDLWLPDNDLSGSIPKELAELSDLKVLLLSKNNLTGPIPPELGQLSRLNALLLDLNKFSGPIPHELGELQELLGLHVNDNQLTGPVPPELGQLSKLESLNLSNNALTGSLPRSLLKLENLNSFDFSGQELCAPQDSEFQEWLKKIAFVLGPTCVTVGTEDTNGGEVLPEKFAVHGNYPNPFQKTTHLAFDLPWQAHVRVEVVDVIGRLVLTVPEHRMEAGWEKSIPLNGESLPAGIYLYRLIADSPLEYSVQTGSFVRIR